MKRISIDVPDDFQVKVKVACAKNNKTIKNVVVELLSKWMEEQEAKEKQEVKKSELLVKTDRLT